MKPDPLPVPKDPRHQRFADRILAGDSQTDAYLAAGFKVARDIARKNAKRLERRPDVQAYLEAVRQASAQGTVLELMEKRRFFARVVRVPVTAIDPDDPDDPNRDLLKKVRRRFTQKEGPDGEPVQYCTEELEKYDALKAIAEDNKLSGDDPEANALADLASALSKLGGPALPVDRM
jgi:hypothetical protein